MTCKGGIFLFDYDLLKECLSVTLDILPYFLTVGIGLFLIQKGVEFVKKCCLVPVCLPDVPDCENLEYYGSCEDCPYYQECDIK